jgi:Protein of unknown function (DUF2281)
MPNAQCPKSAGRAPFAPTLAKRDEVRGWSFPPTFIQSLPEIPLKLQAGEIMAIDAEILQTLDQMPESLKQELLHYAKYLLENYSKAVSGESLLQKKPRSGILKGTFVLPLPDDFDEPLEVFKEYME